MRRTPTLVLAAALLCLVLAVPASAETLNEKLVKDFGADGTLNACLYTDAEVKLMKSLIGNDTDAYDPGVREAVDALFEERAQGKCNKKKQSGGGGGSDSGDSSGAAGTTSSGGGGSPTPATDGESRTPAAPGVAKAAPAPGTPQTASPLIDDGAIATALRTADEGDVPPFPLLALGVLLALLALGTIVYGVIRFTGWEPAWAPRARHAAAEAGWRASSTWAEFTDFVRLGR